jgi:hypothetical protein
METLAVLMPLVATFYCNSKVPDNVLLVESVRLEIVLCFLRDLEGHNHKLESSMVLIRGCLFPCGAGSSTLSLIEIDHSRKTVDRISQNAH